MYHKQTMHAGEYNETTKGNYSKTNVNIEFSVSNLNRWQIANHLTRSNASHMVNMKTKKHTFHFIAIKKHKKPKKSWLVKN